jgi:hypothetical protein
MANIYDINWQNVGENLLFHRWRKNSQDNDNNLLSYINAIMSSLQVLSDKLLSLRNETVDILQYTGQHKVLEEFLNDRYDSITRGIYIIENNTAQFAPVAIGLSTDTIDSGSELVLGITSDTVTTQVAMALSGEVQEDNNFTVYIPISVLFNEITLRAQLDAYVLASKNYNIVVF